MSLNIPSISGFTQSQRLNAGTMNNSGVEFSMNYKETISDDFDWSAGFHFATIKNRITKLMREGQRIYSGNIKPGQTELTMVGHPVASFYGYVTDGIFQNPDEISSAARQNPGTAPGDIRFRDLNGDGIINEDDQTFLGSPIPKFTYGFNLSAKYKEFDFAAFFNGVAGNKVLSAYQYYTQGFFISNYNLEKETLNRWTAEGTSNKIPRLTASDPNNNSRVSDYYLQSGSFLRLQNVTLGYTFKSEVIKALKNLRVYVSAQNLLTFTKYTGYDPEVGQQYSGAGGTLDIGIDNGNYPQSRTISAGVNVSF
jgi:TonB dependent receptor.